jgi:hypothetical protein
MRIEGVPAPASDANTCNVMYSGKYIEQLSVPRGKINAYINAWKREQIRVRVSELCVKVACKQ